MLRGRAKWGKTGPWKRNARVSVWDGDGHWLIEEGDGQGLSERGCGASKDGVQSKMENGRCGAKRLI